MSFVCPSRTLRDKTAQILLPPAGECGVDIHYRVGGEAAGAADPLLLSDFDDARALPQLGRLLKGRNCRSVDDPVGPAGDRKRVRTGRRQVSVGRPAPVGEYRTDIRSDLVDLLRKFSNQKLEKRGRYFRGHLSDPRADEFGDLFDGEEDRKGLAKGVAGAANLVDGDFKTIGPLQGGARERRAYGGPLDLAEPMALPTSIKRRPGQVGIKVLEFSRASHRARGGCASGRRERSLRRSA